MTTEQHDGSRAVASKRLRAIGMYPGERRLVGAVAALFAITQASQGLGINTADTLFFLRFGVEFLPIMILVSGPLAMIATLGYAAGLAREGAARWFVPVLSALAGLAVIERIGVAFRFPGVYAVIWIGAQLAIVISYAVMWNAAGEVCTTRQAKRLFPLFATAGIGGGIVGNALTGPLASALGTENLLFVHAALLIAAAVVTAIFVRPLFRTEDPVVKQSVVTDLREGLRLTIATPLLRLVAWSAVGLSVLYFLVAFPFSEVVAGSFQTETEVARYLGLFSAAATALTFVVSLFAANRLFARIGVVATLLIVPVVYVAGFGLWLVSFGLVSATLVRGAQWVVGNALGGTAWSSLFNVLPGRRRSQVMAFISGVPAQLGITASGGLLLLGSELAPHWRASIGLVIGVWVAVLVARMRRAYADALVGTVKHGIVEVFSTPTQGIQQATVDAEMMRALSTALSDSQLGVRTVAAGLLGRLEPETGIGLVAKALSDREPRVRAAALEAVAEHETSVAFAREMLKDPSAEVRRRAIEVLALHGATLDDSEMGALDDPDPSVRSKAATLVDRDLGQPVIENMLRSDDPMLLVAVLEAISAQKDLNDYGLTPYARHTDRRVRAAAARGMARQVDGPMVLRTLLDDSSVRVREAAAEALAATTENVPVLFDVLASGSVRACDAALIALTNAGLAKEQLSRWVDGEVRRARFLRSHRLALSTNSTSPTRVYLCRLLLLREHRLERWALTALSAPEGDTSMPIVRRGVWSDNVEIRAQAIEALDSLGQRSRVRDLIALLEEHPTLDTMDERTSLRELTRDFDEWIRALSTRCLVEELIADFDLVRFAVATDQSALVRATVSRWTSHMETTNTLDTMDRVLALQRVPMFSNIDPEDLERVALVTTERRYRADELVYQEGAPGDEMLIIVSGNVEIRHVDGSMIRSYGAGQHVGELALLRRATRAANVIAGAEGLHALSLGASELTAILEERPEVALAMMATLAERLGTM